MGHAEALEMLGAYALDACDEREIEALEAHLHDCPACAAEADRLRLAASWLGTLEAKDPPPRVRDAVLAGAADRRRTSPPTSAAPSSATSVEGVPGSDPASASGGAHPGDMYAEQVQGLDDTLRSLEPDDWRRLASEADGWSVQDLIAHLTATDTLLAEQLELRSVANPNDRPDVAGRTEALLARNRGRVAQSTAMDWRDQARTIARHVSGLSGADLDRRIEWLGVPMPLRRALIGRAFEIWTHADDIRGATGRPKRSPRPAQMHVIADLAVRSLPAALRIMGADHRGKTARVVLTGDGGGEWVLALGKGQEPGRPDVTLTADVVDFCLVAAGRLAPVALERTIEGEALLGADLLRAVPAFAGP